MIKAAEKIVDTFNTVNKTRELDINMVFWIFIFYSHW
jgi:hypothetical protein